MSEPTSHKCGRRRFDLLQVRTTALAYGPSYAQHPRDATGIRVGCWRSARYINARGQSDTGEALASDHGAGRVRRVLHDAGLSWQLEYGRALPRT